MNIKQTGYGWIQCLIVVIVSLLLTVSCLADVETICDVDGLGQKETLTCSPLHSSGTHFLQGRVAIESPESSTTLFEMLGNYDNAMLGYAHVYSQDQSYLLVASPGLASTSPGGEVFAYACANFAELWTVKFAPNYVILRLALISDQNDDSIEDALVELVDITKQGVAMSHIAILSGASGEILLLTSASFTLSLHAIESGADLTFKEDVDRDGDIDTFDVSEVVLAATSQQFNSLFDFNNDLLVNVEDVALVAAGMQAFSSSGLIRDWNEAVSAVFDKRWEDLQSSFSRVSVGNMVPQGCQLCNVLESDYTLKCVPSCGSTEFFFPVCNSTYYVGEHFRLDIDYRYLGSGSWFSPIAGQWSWILPPELSLTYGPFGEVSLVASAPGTYVYTEIVQNGNCCFYRECSVTIIQREVPVEPCNFPEWFGVAISNCPTAYIDRNGTSQYGAVFPGQFITLYPNFFEIPSGAPLSVPPGAIVRWDIVQGQEWIATKRSGPLDRSITLECISDSPQLIGVRLRVCPAKLDECCAEAMCIFWVSPDSDGDGLVDVYESYSDCPLINVPDSDADFVADGIEAFISQTDPCDDSDVSIGYLNQLRDSDQDGLSDYEETRGYLVNPPWNMGPPRLCRTSAWVFDTDRDGVGDMLEKLRKTDGSNPLDSWRSGTFDLDGDGLSDIYEQQRGLDAANPDSDSDGILDGVEISRRLDPLVASAGPRRAVTAVDGEADTDDDGLSDDEEVAMGSNPSAADSDSDGLTDLQEIELGLSWLSFDSDNDGLSDGFELRYRFEPLDPDTDNDGLSDGQNDTDGDGRSNFQEEMDGTNPLVIDSTPKTSSVRYYVRLSALPRYFAKRCEGVEWDIRCYYDDPHVVDNWGVRVGSSPVLRVNPNSNATDELIEIPDRYVGTDPTALKVQLVYLGLNSSGFASALAGSLFEEYAENEAFRNRMAPLIKPHWHGCSFQIYAQVGFDGPLLDMPLIGGSNQVRSNTGAVEASRILQRYCISDEDWRMCYEVRASDDRLVCVSENCSLFSLRRDGHLASPLEARPSPHVTEDDFGIILFGGASQYGVMLSLSALAGIPNGLIDLHCWRSDSGAGECPSLISEFPSRFDSVDLSYGSNFDGRMNGFVDAIAADGASPVLLYVPKGLHVSATLLRVGNGRSTSVTSADVDVDIYLNSRNQNDFASTGDWTNLEVNGQFRDQTTSYVTRAKPWIHGGLYTSGSTIDTQNLFSMIPAIWNERHFTEHVDAGGGSWIVYVPPECYVSRRSRLLNAPELVSDHDALDDPGTANGLCLDNRTLLAIRVQFESVGGTPSRFIGNSYKSIKLVKPPVVVAHGLNSSTQISFTENDPGGATFVPNGPWVRGDLSSSAYVSPQTDPCPDVNFNRSDYLYAAAPISYADYASTSHFGFAENMPVFPRTIQRTLRRWRPWLAGYPTPQANGFNLIDSVYDGLAIAATRADVVAHSMGGQIARLYISQTNPIQYARAMPGWPNVNISRNDDLGDQRWYRNYLRPENYGIGDIHRFIPIGSPFNGSCQADLVAGVLNATTPIWPTLQLQFIQYQDGSFGVEVVPDFTRLISRDAFWTDVRNRQQLQLQVPGLAHFLRLFYPVINGPFVPPTGVADLQPSSTVNFILSSANYPVGRKEVVWAPASATATLNLALIGPYRVAQTAQQSAMFRADPTFATSFVINSVWQNLEAFRNLMDGNLEFSALVGTYLECDVFSDRLGQISDTVVHLDSQRNVDSSSILNQEGHARDYLYVTNTTHTYTTHDCREWEGHHPAIAGRAVRLMETNRGLPSDQIPLWGYKFWGQSLK